jgi:hypothetical protein
MTDKQGGTAEFPFVPERTREFLFIDRLKEEQAIRLNVRTV